MSNQIKKTKMCTKARTLDEKEFAAISEVEGLKLGPASKQRLAALKARDLTPAQKRREVLRAYAGAKHR